MSRTYKRVTEGLDPERGDAATIRLKDVAPLVRQLPTEVTAPIFDAFMRWFCNVAEPELKDALARVMVEQFKERQRDDVKRYIATCNSRSPAKPTDGDGETQVETSIHKSLNKTKVKNEDNEVKSSVLYGGEAATTDGLSPSASPSSSDSGRDIGKDDIIEARKTMARYAPAPKFVLAFDIKKCDGKYTADDDNDSHNIDERAKRSMEKVKEFYLKGSAEWDEEPCWYQVSKSLCDFYGKQWDEDGVALCFIGSSGQMLRAAWRKYHDTLGDTTFLNAIWTFWIARWTGGIPATDKDGNKTNEGKLLFGRLKQLVEAKALLAQYDEQRKPKS